MVNPVYGRRSQRQMLKKLGKFSNDPQNPLHIEDSDGDSDNDNAINQNIVEGGNANFNIEVNNGEAHHEDVIVDNVGGNHHDDVNDDNVIDDNVEPDIQIHESADIAENEVQDSDDDAPIAKKNRTQNLIRIDNQIRNKPFLSSSQRQTRSLKRKMLDSNLAKHQMTKKLRSPLFGQRTPSNLSSRSRLMSRKKSMKHSAKTRKHVASPLVSNVKRNQTFLLRIRTSPSTMYEALRGLTEDQRETVKEMGFGGFLNMKLSTSPLKLAHYIVEHLDDCNLILKTGISDIQLTSQLVHDILGIPNGGLDIDDLEELPETDKLYASWKNQFK